MINHTFCHEDDAVRFFNDVSKFGEALFLPNRIALKFNDKHFDLFYETPPAAAPTSLGQLTALIKTGQVKFFYFHAVGSVNKLAVSVLVAPETDEDTDLHVLVNRL